MVVACYSAGGLFSPAIILGCNAALGTCMAGCAALIFSATVAVFPISVIIPIGGVIITTPCVIYYKKISSFFDE